ncbi:MAG TPA: phage tail tube protein [Candidatus Paceibacterota bacterium]|mgnify:CR=1 FL=1|nr:phage tail tube protein [Candidatus Paceibacterota bacterium]
MSTPLFSKLMSVQIDSSTVACATDFSLSISKDVIEIACLDSEGAKESVPDMYSWSVSGSGMVFRTVGATAGSYSLFDMADNLLTTDASVLVQLVPDVSSNKYFSGAGYFTSLSMEGGVGAPVSYSFEITGSGTLSVKTTD